MFISLRATTEYTLSRICDILRVYMGSWLTVDNFFLCFPWGAWPVATREMIVTLCFNNLFIYWCFNGTKQYFTWATAACIMKEAWYCRGEHRPALIIKRQILPLYSYPQHN